MGGCCLVVRSRKLSNAKNIKNVMALDTHVTIFHMQQPTKNTQVRWSGYKRAVVTRGEHTGGMTPSFWALEVERR